ncbi:MAG: hypothetical protein REI94_08895 [Moraxellaceae bacterium]|nr:hypothetical protein [Moraxellaceae bacterium]
MPLHDNDPFDTHRGRSAGWERALRPQPAQHGWLWLVAGALVVGLAAWGAHAWWEHDRARVRAKQRTALPPAPVGARTAVPAPALPAPPVPARPASLTIAKCVTVDGRTVGYGDGPCPAGARQVQVAIEPGLNLADGLTPEQRDAHVRSNRAAAQAQRAHEEAVARNVDVDPGAECRALAALIAQLDAWARQPNDPATLDDIRGRRQTARDRQFRLGCQYVR